MITLRTRLRPGTLRSTDYITVAFAGAFLVFCANKVVDDLPAGVILSLDAAGLSLFCVVGARRALDRGMNALVAVLLGTNGAAGGGVVRDVLITRVPMVLREQIYGVAALFGATGDRIAGDARVIGGVWAPRCAYSDLLELMAP